MLIAVSVEDGTGQSIEEKDGNTTLAKPLRVVGHLDSDRFDAWVQKELGLGEKSLIQPPHVDHCPDGIFKDVGTIRYSSNPSPRICVDFNGVPICFP
jgi:hypothetical protein